MRTKMNIKQANTSPLIDLLAKWAYRPNKVSTNGIDYWYKSPLRTENTASFHVNKNKNLWHDFGTGEGGGVVDFVMKLKNCDASTALKTIETAINQPIVAAAAPKQPKILRGGEKNENEAFSLLKTQRTFSPSLTRYIAEERKINLALIKDHAVEVQFKNPQGKTFFGIGMKNISGGYEIRNAYFKGNVGAKDVTFIKSTHTETTDTLAIFEGMFDFFSAMTYFGKTFLENDIMILNSVHFQSSAAHFIRELPPYKKFSLFLDNDAAGTATSELFQTQFPDTLIEPAFALYLPHKDFNTFLVKRRS